VAVPSIRLSPPNSHPRSNWITESVLVLALLVFGAKRLPEMGRSLGVGLRGFKESVTGEQSPPQIEE